MAKNVNSKRAIFVATVCITVSISALWLTVAQSVSIPFVYRGKWIAFLVLAYVQLSLLTTWTLIRNDLIQKGLALTPKRERWWGAGGVVIGPLILSYVLTLLIPLIGSNLSNEVAGKKFTYVSTEPYARTSRGLVQLKLVADKGDEYWVVFKKERVEKWDMKCGDTLTTVGRNSFLGYVIDSEVKANGVAQPCPQG